MNDVRQWYDGYRAFGGHALYNPWSVLSFASHPEMGLRPYWVRTASDDALRSAVLEHGHDLAPELEELLAGRSVTKTIDDNIVLRDLDLKEDAVWSLLLASGYVTAQSWQLDEHGDTVAELVIPNHELGTAWRTSIESWLKHGLSRLGKLSDLWTAMLTGNAEAFGELLTDLVVRTLSFHDIAGSKPERVYQAFLLGLLVEPPQGYRVVSNREAGFGRFDVSVVSSKPGRPGVVLELKRIGRVETPETALDAAMQQLVDKRYAEELVAAGAAPIIQYGVVFDGKRVWVRKG